MATQLTWPARALSLRTMNVLQDSLLELIRRTSAEIPDDVHKAILDSLEREKQGTIAASAMKIIEQNIALAKNKSQPICQDTGSIIFYVDCPVGYDQLGFEEAAREAVKLATKKGFLRQNSVDSITGKNDGTNVGPGSPAIHFHQHSLARGQRAARPQRRRLRKRRRAILPAQREAQGQPRPGRLPQGDSRRGLAGAGQRLRAGHPRRLHRRRPRHRLRVLEAAIPAQARRHATPTRNSTSWSRTSSRPPTSSASARWVSAARPLCWARRSAC